MAVARVKRVELIAHNLDKSTILSQLEKASILQVKLREESLNPEEISTQLSEKAASIQERLSKANFLLRLLKHYYSPKISTIDSFIPPKILVNQKDLEKTVKTFELEKLYEEIEKVDVNLHHSEAELKELTIKNRQLLPWKNIDFDPSDLETENTVTMLGTLPNQKEASFSKGIEQSDVLVHYQIVKRGALKTFVALFVHRQGQEKLKQILKNHEFEAVKLPSINKSVTRTIKNIDTKIRNLKNNREELISKIRNISKHQKELVIISNVLSSEHIKANIEKELVHTNNVFVLEGWIKAKDSAKFKNIVSQTTKSYSLSFYDPKPDEEPPIVLENPRWLKPLEAVTALYGMPDYHEIDPTPLMAPFFLIFFGLAIGDVAYGLALVIISLLLRRSSRFRESTKTFLTLFVYGGAVAAFFGVITGSWLTIEQASLPSFLKSLVIFDPIKEPALFLVITLILGFIQLYFGMIIKFFDIVKKQSLSKALQAQLPYLIFFPALTLLIAAFLGLELSSTLNTIAIYSVLAGSLGIILFSNTEAENISSRIGGGLFNLYNTNSLLGDTISYARIMALGLATFLIGSAINTIAILLSTITGPLFLKVLLSILIIIGATSVHLLNLAINTISAFVHPARLQYVEFFSQFFEGGGSRFKPLELKTENLII